MKTLSIQRPRPSIEIATPASASAPVKAAGELRALDALLFVKRRFASALISRRR